MLPGLVSILDKNKRYSNIVVTEASVEFIYNFCYRNICGNQSYDIVWAVLVFARTNVNLSAFLFCMQKAWKLRIRTQKTGVQ